MSEKVYELRQYILHVIEQTRTVFVTAENEEEAIRKAENDDVIERTSDYMWTSTNECYDRIFDESDITSVELIGEVEPNGDDLGEDE